MVNKKKYPAPPPGYHIEFRYRVKLPDGREVTAPELGVKGIPIHVKDDPKV